jgi:hypothetical protein
MIPQMAPAAWWTRTVLALAAAGAAAVFSATTGHAHGSSFVSRYTYNDDVFPVIMNRCSRCHVGGGVAPMSLLTYDEAAPWADSIRVELLDLLSGSATNREAFVRQAHGALSGRELDVFLEWAAGAKPLGNKAKTLPRVSLKNDWPSGRPDLLLPMPSEHRIPANQIEDTSEIVLPVALSDVRLVRAVDFLPGTPAVVREASVSVNGQNVLTWVPRQSFTLADRKTPLRLSPESRIVVRIRYKKTWQHENVAMTDRSTVGFYYVR